MDCSIATNYINKEDTENINIDDVVLQSGKGEFFIFTDGSSLSLSSNPPKAFDASFEVELFIEDENDHNPPKLCIVKNQYVGKSKNTDDFMATVLYLDSDLNGAVSFLNEEKEAESRKLCSEEVLEKLYILNINPLNIKEGLTNYNDVQKKVKDKYKEFIGNIEPTSQKIEPINKKKKKKRNNRNLK